MTYIDDIVTLFGSGIVQYLPFDDTSGTTARDASGNARTGAYTGTFTLGAAGPLSGTSVNLNATGDINAYSASLAGAFDGVSGAMCLWVSMASAASWNDASNYYLAYFGVDSTNYVYMRKSGSDKYLLGIRFNGSTYSSVTIHPPESTRWLHVGLVWDQDNDAMSVYLNGMRGVADTGLSTWSGTVVTGRTQWGDIGSSLGNATWPGKIAHGLLLSVVPTAAQMRTVAASPGIMAFDGDSRTAQSVSWYIDAADDAHPSGDLVFGGFGVGSFAVGGQTTAQMITNAAAATGIDSQIGAGRNVLTVWAGINDPVGGGTAATIYANLAAYCAARRAAGWDKILVCTEIDGQSAALNSAGWHATIYPALNTLLRAGYTDFADYLIDLGADERLQDATNTTYFNADAVHLTAAGFDVVAELATPYLAAATINVPAGRLTLPSR